MLEPEHVFSTLAKFCAGKKMYHAKTALFFQA